MSKRSERISNICRGVFGARVRVVRLKLGSEVLELTEYFTPQGRAIPVNSRSNDRWFQHIAIIVSDMTRHMHTCVPTRCGMPPPDRKPCRHTSRRRREYEHFILRTLTTTFWRSFHSPPDKGAKKWHELGAGGKLFLGIDHTADRCR